MCQSQKKNTRMLFDINKEKKKLLRFLSLVTICLGVLISAPSFSRTSDVSWSPSVTNKKIDGFVAEKVKMQSVFDKIGLKPGDKLLEINGEPVRGIVQLMTLSQGLRNNQQYDLKLLRDGQIVEMKAQL